jgi:acyl-CoA oxidase
VLERTAARSLGQLIADAIPRGEEASNILDRDYHAYLFAWREKHVLEAAARRLRKLMATGGDAFSAFNAVQDHLLLAARAHVDRVVLEHFNAAIDRCGDAELKALLNRVCDLHVMAILERDRGWFMEHGQLSAARAKAVITNVNRLCRELRPHAQSLVDAFGIPEVLLPSFLSLPAKGEGRVDRAS